MNQGRTILVVDDDYDLRTVLCAVLSGEGYDAVGVADGVEALDHMHRNELPALLIADLMMPRMDGEHLVRRMTEEPALAKVPVAIMSGRGNACVAKRPGPVAACLVKPVELDELLAIVSRYASRSEQPV